MAQDVHFSQFMEVPSHLNPGLTGAFDGDFRLTANQRTQWRSVTQPYQTFALAYDQNLFSGGLWAAGLSFIQDKAGDGSLKTTILLLAAVRSFNFSGKNSPKIRWGIQSGLYHQSIDFSAFNFDEQWNPNGYFDPGIASTESFYQDSYSHLQLNSGLTYRQRLGERNELNAGAAVYHLTTPRQSFQRNSEYISLKVNLHAEFAIAISQKLTILPRSLLTVQGKMRELVFGAKGHYLFNDRGGSDQAIFAGLYFRDKDAGIVQAGVDYDAWQIALSYDLNVSALESASQYKGGFEISARYIFKRPKLSITDKKLCPEFL